MYANVQDLRDRFEEVELVQLTDTAMLGEIDSAKVAMALSDASSEIDGYLAKLYKLPINPLPPVLRKLACDIARYRLYLNRADMPDMVSKAYQSAIDYLKQIAKGLIALDAEGNAPSEQATILTDYPPRRTGRDKMWGY